MNEEGARTSDGELLARLDALLDLEAGARAAELARLSGENPALAARLARMLHAAADADGSRVLAAPVLAGLDAAHRLAVTVLAPGEICAGYRLIRELGRGGMSLVWLAARADGVIKREVAIKLPLLVLSTADQAQRFERERDALAALNHPNIARLYDAGVAANGQPFIVLEFVDGISITDWCDGRRLDVRARLRLFEQVLAAVADAHRNLLVHRDLKPANILVDTDGRVKLLDFGIAKLLGDPGAAPLTQLGGAALTPRYAAPEQLAGGPITTLTDVYSAGVVLHELLTGVLPYGGSALAGASLGEVAEAVLRSEPTRPSGAAIDPAAAAARGAAHVKRLRAELAGDLDTIVRTALAKTPAERYASVERMATDVAAFLAHRPIAARPPSLAYSLRRLVRRHRGASIVAAAGALLALGIGGLAWQQHRQSVEHAARTASVRDFMFDLVSDAEPDESQGNAEITGRQMIDGAVRRAHRDFSGDPRLQGELLAELGRMYRRVDAPEPARRVLVEALALLERQAPPDDPALNKTRAHLADLEYSSGNHPRARTLAAQARGACANEDPECAKARAYASHVLARLASNEGHHEQALEDMRRRVDDTALAFGPTHPETALARMDFATIARNAGRLQEASAALETALAQTRGSTLRAADRIQLTRTMAVLDFDLGRYALARERLQQLLVRTREPEEHALQLRLLANTELALGNPAAARDAAAAAFPGAADDPNELQIVHQVHARAMMLLGENAAALTEIRATVAEMSAMNSEAGAPAVLRARRVYAELLARDGQLVAAGTELAAVNAVHARDDSPWEAEWAQALDLAGAVARERGLTTQALADHAQARTLLAKQLPADHPLLLRNDLYAAAVALRAAENVSNREAFNGTAARFVKLLPQSSRWIPAIAAFADAARCPAAGATECGMIL